MVILFEDSVEGYGDINPFGALRQQWCYNLMVTLTAREYFAILDDFLNFWRKPRLGIVRNSYNDEPLHIIRLIR